MYVLFEEDGAFKTATVLTDNDASLQVETASGKRSKIKSANVLLRYKEPAPGELLARCEPLVAEIEAEFLWECASDGEFHFCDFADEYFGHKASAVEATALLQALHSAPVYFHRKGKGRYRKAPADILAAALAGLEKKRQQALAVEQVQRGDTQLAARGFERLGLETVAVGLAKQLVEQRLELGRQAESLQLADHALDR